MRSTEDLKKIDSQVRRDIIRMVALAKSGHPGGSMSSTDFMTALYFEVMDQDPATWTREGAGQDTFIQSSQEPDISRSLSWPVSASSGPASRDILP